MWFERINENENEKKNEINAAILNAYISLFMSIDLFCILKYHRKQGTFFKKMQSDGRNKYDKLHGSV